MRVLTGGAILLASILAPFVQAQQCLTHPCPAGNYCYQGYCYPYQNPGPPPGNPCYYNPNSYACQNYCYYNPYDQYCPGPYPPYQDPCIANPYLAQCGNYCYNNPYAPGCGNNNYCFNNPYAPGCGNNYCVTNPYAPGCPNAQALDAAGNFLNNVNPLGLFPGQNQNTAPPPTTSVDTPLENLPQIDPSSFTNFGASDASAPPPSAEDAAPPSRVKRAFGGLWKKDWGWTDE